MGIGAGGGMLLGMDNQDRGAGRRGALRVPVGQSPMRTTHEVSLRERVIELAVEVGTAVTIDPDILSVSLKSSLGDLVTNADLAIQTRLFEGLHDLLPNASLLGEEHTTQAWSEDTWVVDPVDGTTNMVHGFPHAAVSIALFRSGEPHMAIIHNPFSQSTYFATSGSGSFVRDHRSNKPDRRLRASLTRQLQSSLVSFGLPYDRSEADMVFATMSRIFDRCQDIRRTGSAALDIAFVAQGRLDAHVELSLRPWDVAASGILLTEAGGVVTDWAGRSICWSEGLESSSVLASNSMIHKELLALLGEGGAVSYTRDRSSLRSAGRVMASA